MIFKTLKEYDKELKEMEIELNDAEEYIEKHPEAIGVKGNYETMKYVYQAFQEEKRDFIQKTNEINLNLKSNMLNGSMKISNIFSLSKKFNTVKNITTSSLGDYLNEELLIKEISQGSYNIKFAFPNPTSKDTDRTSLRKKGLIKFFSIIQCGEDIEKIKKEMGNHNKEFLMAYKEFLEEIMKYQADFTLDTENGSLKVGLTLKQTKKICKNLQS